MRRPLRFLHGGSVLLALVALGACSIPGQPEPLPFSTTPRIVDVSTNPPGAVGAPMTLTVSGSNFYQGLTLFVTLPDAHVVDISGDHIQALNSASFRATIPFAASGTYYFVVQNTDELSSKPFSIDLPASAP